MLSVSVLHYHAFHGTPTIAGPQLKAVHTRGNS